jgi:hypothetical protein
MVIFFASQIARSNICGTCSLLSRTNVGPAASQDLDKRPSETLN